VEASDALQRWRNECEQVRDFLKRLPPDGQNALRAVAGTLNRVGPDAVDHARNHTFHYPAPSTQYDSDGELLRALTALGDVPVEIGDSHARPGRSR
jgi:hypothetical protein